MSCPNSSISSQDDSKNNGIIDNNHNHDLEENHNNGAFHQKESEIESGNQITNENQNVNVLDLEVFKVFFLQIQQKMDLMESRFSDLEKQVKDQTNRYEKLKSKSKVVNSEQIVDVNAGNVEKKKKDEEEAKIVDEGTPLETVILNRLDQLSLKMSKIENQIQKKENQEQLL